PGPSLGDVTSSLGYLEVPARPGRVLLVAISADQCEAADCKLGTWQFVAPRALLPSPSTAVKPIRSAAAVCPFLELCQQTTDTTRWLYSATSRTRTSRTRSGTPKWRHRFKDFWRG